MSRAPAWVRALITLALATAAGAVLAELRVPLGWLIGAMLVMIGASAARLPAIQPVVLVPWIKASVGTLLGASITLPVILSIPEWWVTILAMFAVMAVAGAVNYRLLCRAFGFTPVDAALCSVPGGIAEMILLGERAGADQSRVAVVHAIRIALSILIIPPLIALFYGITITRGGAAAPVAMSGLDWGYFALCIVAGAAADRFTRIPAPFIVVPAGVCAALHLSGLTHFAVPGTVSQIMQVVIGLNVGARFQNLSLGALVRVFGAALAVVGTQIALALLAALLLSRSTGFDPLAVTLAYAPGGLAEMSLIAIAMHRDVAFVGLHHLLRVLFSLGLAPALIHRLQRSAS
ncbi:AbrB family transcriptional regulator [Phaeovulum sp. W22_SRMD_FR3]|uniref:AbrB family transcriptional regulator n=1 Tax=Phaeovulum sp. W22_SRMD_FR3 TaxID=3240274 RepID=UPI003F9A4BBF